MNYTNLDEANKRIAELETEIAKLKSVVHELKSKKTSGRKPHNDKWQETYMDFVSRYEKGETLIEIASANNLSKRTIYRYKSYYDNIKNSNSSS